MFYSHRYFANGKGISTMRELCIFKILRNFGHLISNLNLYMILYRKYKDKIECYVNKYCSKSVQTLRIYSCGSPHNILKTDLNSFPNLKKLNIKYCHYEPNLWKFEHTAFPNLQTLKLNLNWMDSIDSPKIEFQTFPALKSFSFDGTMGHYYDMRNYTDVIEMIKLNTQLEKFEIALLEHCDQQSFELLMQHIVEYLPNLQCLNLIFSGPTSVFSVRDSYHFDKVTDFGLFNIPITFLTKIPFTFHKLKRFTITTAEKTFTEHLNYPQIWDFMANNKHLTSIFLHGKVNGSFITNYEYVFANVEELFIHKCQDIPINTVLGFLKNRLKLFSISGMNGACDTGNYHDICKKLKVNEIEFKVKQKYLDDIVLELFIKVKSDFSLIHSFIECSFCFNYIKFYSNDVLKCYKPPMNAYYAEYAIAVKGSIGVRE